MLGALPRIVRHGRSRDSILLGVGVAALANSRPYEGLVLSLLAAIVLFVQLSLRARAESGARVWRRLTPTALVLFAAFCWTGYYNFRVTGDALSMPYSVNADTYQGAPLFQFQASRAAHAEYRHEDMRRTYETWAYTKPKDLAMWLGFFRGRSTKYWIFFLGQWWSIALIALPWTLRKRGVQLCLAACVLVLCSHSITTYGGWPHYVAPATGALVALLTAALRKLTELRVRAFPPGQPGQRTSRGLPAAHIANHR